MTPQIPEGTWEEIAQYAETLVGKRVRVTILGEGPESEMDTRTPRSEGRMKFGMFKGSPEPTDEDFRSAEFHGSPDDWLD